jgi:hypothetical protein
LCSLALKWHKQLYKWREWVNVVLRKLRNCSSMSIERLSYIKWYDDSPLKQNPTGVHDSNEQFKYKLIVSSGSEEA